MQSSAKAGSDFYRGRGGEIVLMPLVSLTLTFSSTVNMIAADSFSCFASLEMLEPLSSSDQC